MVETTLTNYASLFEVYNYTYYYNNSVQSHPMKLEEMILLARVKLTRTTTIQKTFSALVSVLFTQ